MNPQSAIHDPRSEKILVRGVNWLGDAVMTTPALLRLREQFPRAHIFLLTHEKLASLWRNHTAVDEVMTFSQGDSLWQVARKMREEQFHIGIALPDSHRAALELWLARIPRRVGYAAPVRNWFLTDPVRPRADFVRMRKRAVAEIQQVIQSSAPATKQPLPPAAHHIYRYLHLVASLGANPEPLPPHIEVTDADVQGAKQKFSLDTNTPWLGLNPGAEYGPAKRWPQERFVAAGIEIQRRAHCRWLIFGGPADVSLATEIAAAVQQQFPSAPPLNLAGKTTLRELCVLLKHCRLLLTNDTGPMHVAAALGTPVVAIFGSTAPELTGPGLPGDSRHCLLKADVPCSPCFLRGCPIDLRCLKGVEVGKVVESILRACETPREKL
jgi:heptosyltransferase-2